MMLRTLVCLVTVTVLASMCECLFEDQACASEFDMLTCNNMIPPSVPSEVTEIYLTIDSYNITFEAVMFADQSWGTITLLDITAQYSHNKKEFKIVFQRGCLRSLHKLKELRFHGDRISYFSVHALANNVHLNLLEFSSCPRLKSGYFINSILSADITVENVSLNHISSEGSDYLKVDDRVIQIIAKCGVINLSLRDSTVIVQHISALPKRPLRLRSVDLSNVHFVYLGTNVHAIYETFDKLSDGLISLNVSEFPLERFAPTANIIKDRSITECSQLEHTNIKLVFNVKNVYADAVFKSKSVIVDNIFLNLSTCLVKLRTIQIRRNRIKYFNMTLYLPSQNNITNIDVSFNEIIYLSPYAFSTATYLLTLNLKSNKLGQMENLREFHQLLQKFAMLEYFSIADNGISNLPSDFFGGNLNLKVLDLSGNVLETITFPILDLPYLKVLNLSFNRIHFLEGKALGYIQSYLTRNDEYKVILDLTGNPFECSCESVKFIELIISHFQPHFSHMFTCEIEDDTNKLNEDSLQKSKFLCYRTAIFVGVSVFLVVAISGSVLLIKYMCKKKYRQREKCAQELFLEKFLKGKLQERYLCLISYASEDEMCILDIINPNLKSALNERFGTECDFICLGDMHFELGRPVVNEILRCISESCVMIYVISNHFCKSQWCEMELREAHTVNKPIILILKQEVHQDKMSPLLATIFNQLTRAKLVVKDGQYELVPDWKYLGESIVKLAANSYIVNGDFYKRQNNEKGEDTTTV